MKALNRSLEWPRGEATIEGDQKDNWTLLSKDTPIKPTALSFVGQILKLRIHQLQPFHLSRLPEHGRGAKCTLSEETHCTEGRASNEIVTALLERNEARRVCSTNTRPPVLHRLVRQRELPQIVPNHLRLRRKTEQKMRQNRRQENSTEARKQAHCKPPPSFRKPLF